MARLYSGDYDFVNGQFDFRAKPKKNGKPWSLAAFYGLVKHLFDNRDRTEATELLKHNELRPDIKVISGNKEKTLKEIEILKELDKQQEQINKNHHRKKEDNVFDWGRGQHIPMKLGVSQLLLDPRQKENQPFIDEWETGLVKIIQKNYGTDTEISFHYNETSCGMHFLKKFYKLQKQKDGTYKASIDKKLASYYNDFNKNDLVQKTHDEIQALVERLAKKYGYTFKQEACLNKSIERNIRTKQKLLEKIETGKKLNYKEKQLYTKLEKKFSKSSIPPEIQEAIEAFKDADEHGVFNVEAVKQWVKDSHKDEKKASIGKQMKEHKIKLKSGEVVSLYDLANQMFKQKNREWKINKQKTQQLQQHAPALTQLQAKVVKKAIEEDKKKAQEQQEKQSRGRGPVRQ